MPSGGNTVWLQPARQVSRHDVSGAVIGCRPPPPPQPSQNKSDFASTVRTTVMARRWLQAARTGGHEVNKRRDRGVYLRVDDGFEWAQMARFVEQKNTIWGQYGTTRRASLR